MIAPSSPFDREAFEAGVARLSERYDVRYDHRLFSRKGFLAGDDERRLAEILDALRAPDVRAIVAARGGYGATRLLDRIDAAEVARAKKLLVGFSDVTALHALWARARVRSIHGPMVAALGTCDRALVDRWIAAVEGEAPPALTDLRAIAPGVADGPLVGGNLAVLAALVGTPYAPPIDGAVLFLEDVGEAPYRVDRMLTQLHHAGWLARASAIVLGAFTESRPRSDGATVDEVLYERLQGAKVPVVSGLRAGHVDDNLELPFGAHVRVDATSGSVHFLEAAVER